MKGSLAVIALVLASIPAVHAHAQTSTVSGQWKEPGGSVIQIDPCGTSICATLIAISPSAPTRVDAYNPSPPKRSRPLCGLQIGTGFHLSSPGKADSGLLYDPKTGKTYHGSMTAQGNTLALRGYVGIKAFGRTETWTRTSGVAQCTK